jgi:hypothetical protein
VKISMKLLIVVAILGFATTGLGQAQQAPKEAAKAKAASEGRSEHGGAGHAYATD